MNKIKKSVKSSKLVLLITFKDLGPGDPHFFFYFIFKVFLPFNSVLIMT